MFFAMLPAILSILIFHYQVDTKMSVQTIKYQIDPILRTH